MGLPGVRRGPPAPPAGVSPEAVLTLDRRRGQVREVTLSPGSYADSTNRWEDEAVTQSNWNDWEFSDYTIRNSCSTICRWCPGIGDCLGATLEELLPWKLATRGHSIFMCTCAARRDYDPSSRHHGDFTAADGE